MQCINGKLYLVRDNGLFFGFFFFFFFVHFFLSFFSLSKEANVNCFVKNFSRTIKSTNLIIGMQCINGELYLARDNGLFWLFCSFFLSFFFLSILLNLLSKIFQELLKPEASNLVCNAIIMTYVRGSGLSRLICSFVLSFFFSPYWQTVNFLSKISQEF